MPRAHEGRDEVAGSETAAPATIGQLLGSWEAAPAPARDLRRLHAAALNTYVARALSAGDADEAARERAAALAGPLRASTWTTPEISFAQFATLVADDAPSGSQLDLVLDALSAVADEPCPPIRLGGRSSMPEWALYAMEQFEDEQLREGRRIRWQLVLDDAAAERECRAALEQLAVVWPAMAGVVQTYVREILWYGCDVSSSRSMIVPQAFGALFLNREADRIETVEHLVHEATQFELIARTAVDPLIANRGTPVVSPFRTEPRQLGEVLHTCLAAARITALLDRMLDVVPASVRPRILRRRAVTRSDFLVAMASLANAAQWTPRGQRLFESLRGLEATKPQWR
jgi:hypothetical protein